MKTNFLTHIVPTLPPQPGDAGQYALDLALQLRDQFGISSQFILCDPNWNGPSRIEEFVVRRLRFPNEAGLWSLLASVKDGATVLLHYDGYGYHKHGIPNWLYHGIKSWRTEQKGKSTHGHKQFSTVFHELWDASAQPWCSSFYLQILQKRLVQKLHRQSQISLTSTRQRQALLDAIEPKKTLLMPSSSSWSLVDRIAPKTVDKELFQFGTVGHNLPTSETIRTHADILRTWIKRSSIPV